MRVGIVTQYKRHDSVGVAMRLADLFEAMNHEVSVYSPNDSRGVPKLRPDWDRRVVGGQAVTLMEWAEKQDAIVWTEAPPTIDVALANKSGCKTICLAPWGELTRHAEASLRFFDVVVVPSLYAANMIAHRYEVTTHIVHWDCGTPVSRKDVPPGDRVRVLVPLHGTAAGRTEALQVALSMANLTQWCPWADITITVTPKTLPPATFATLRKHVVTGPHGSLSLVYDDTGFALAPHVFGRHDLTVWPVLYDGFGTVPLQSLCMGTPVVAFSLNPAREIVADGRNGLLVDPYTDASELEPNWRGLEEAMTAVLTEDGALARMAAQTRYLLDHRRMGFRECWIRILQG